MSDVPLPPTFDALPKLGKKQAKLLKGLPALGKYTLSLPASPPEADYSVGLKHLGQMANDSLGDCTIAAVGHAIQTWTSLTKPEEVVLSDATIIDRYAKWCGYVPGDPNTDMGGVATDVLRSWYQNPIEGHSLSGFASIRPGNRASIRDAVYLFGVAYIGVQLPLAAQNGAWDISPGALLTDDNAVGSWGGHAIPIVAYDAETVRFITWGKFKDASWSWLDAYCVAPATKILTAKLEWVAAGDLKVNDHLMGFDEDGPRRKWKSSWVDAKQIIERPCFDLTFDDGTTVRCSHEHEWLCATNNGAKWVRTDRMRCNDKGRTKVIKPVDTWDFDTTREGGYVAAAFDGEGHIHQGDLSGKRVTHGIARSLNAAAPSTYSTGVAATNLGFTQKNNPMFHAVLKLLKDKKFIVRQGTIRPDGVSTLYICRRREFLRFLGSMRPVRLLDKFNPDKMGGLSGDSSRIATLIEKTDVGVRQVVALKTTSKTFVAEGLASHNCDEAYALLSRDWINEAGSAPPGFDFTALEADMQSIRMGR